jgi:hypothetical protein
VPKAPSMVQTVPAESLVNRINQRWGALQSLTATVEIQASVMKTKEGVAKDYTSFRGHILMRKPELLRVFGQVPILGTKMFDMASDGKNFTLLIPSRSKAVKGSNTIKKKSASQVENMRPGFFFDSMLVRGLDPGDEYMVAADTDTVEDAAKKHLYVVPEYILSIMRAKPGSLELMPVRQVHFHREDLLPYEQDLYDSSGTLETVVLYSSYAKYGANLYPSRVIIKRPLEDYQIVLTVEDVNENMALTDDQFQIKIPEGTKIQNLE